MERVGETNDLDGVLAAIDGHVHQVVDVVEGEDGGVDGGTVVEINRAAEGVGAEGIVGVGLEDVDGVLAAGRWAMIPPPAVVDVPEGGRPDLLEGSVGGEAVFDSAAAVGMVLPLQMVMLWPVVARRR